MNINILFIVKKIRQKYCLKSLQKYEQQIKNDMIFFDLYNKKPKCSLKQLNLNFIKLIKFVNEKYNLNINKSVDKVEDLITNLYYISYEILKNTKNKELILDLDIHLSALIFYLCFLFILICSDEENCLENFPCPLELIEIKKQIERLSKNEIDIQKAYELQEHFLNYAFNKTN